MANTSLRSSCGQCGFFFRIPEDAGDYESGKGDCVTEKKDEKGKYWLSKAVFDGVDACSFFERSQKDD